MIDITTTRTMKTELHPPPIIFAMLFTFAMASALIAGYGMAASTPPKWLHVLGFAMIMALSVYVILDIEYPRLGLIRVDAFDRALVELLNGLN